jgi:hypothetical protein
LNLDTHIRINTDEDGSQVRRLTRSELGFVRL